MNVYYTKSTKTPYKETKNVPQGSFGLMATLQVQVLVGWGVRAEIQVCEREFHTHKNLDYFIVRFLSQIIIKKKKG